MKKMDSLNTKNKKKWSYEKDGADYFYKIYLATIMECYEKNDYITLTKVIANYNMFDKLLKNYDSNK
jgi:hypothetical protein